jgi:hypothetical protein
MGLGSRADGRGASDDLPAGVDLAPSQTDDEGCWAEGKDTTPVCFLFSSVTAG